jgi:hypothetical protein
MFTLLALTALAAQTRSPSEFDGAYALTCERATLTLHVGVAGQLGGVAGSWSDQRAVALSCEGVDVDALAAELSADCAGAGLLESACEDVAWDVALAVAGLDAAAVGLIPEQAAFRVGAGTWFNRWTGLYPLNTTVSWAGGERASATWLVDNNDGPNRGAFAGLGLRVPTSGRTESAGCADLATGAVQGRFLPRANALTATAAVDRSLVCAAGHGEDWLVGQIGLSLRADLSGRR